MNQLEVTFRTKQAIRAWADLGPDVKVFLDHKLSRFLSNELNRLRVQLNAEFRDDPGYPGFPISVGDWADLAPTTVRNVRDEAQRRQA